MAFGVPIGVFYVLSNYCEPSSESVILKILFQHIGFRWIKMLLYAQQYFQHKTYCCL